MGATGSSRLALQFERAQSLQAVVASYRSQGVPVSQDAAQDSAEEELFDQFYDRSRGGFPNVGDPAGAAL